MDGRIALAPMTREMCHALYADWQNDPAVCADLSQFRVYRYDEDAVNRYFDRQQAPDRAYFAILADGRVIGEILLKRIDRERRTCELSIHLQNDRVKNRGFGTQAERLLVRYAFEEMGMRSVRANALRGNARSRRALEKAGFSPCGEDGPFACYRIEREERALRAADAEAAAFQTRQREDEADC